VLAAKGDAWKVHEILSTEIEQVLLGLVQSFSDEARTTAQPAEGDRNAITVRDRVRFL